MGVKTRSANETVGLLVTSNERRQWTPIQYNNRRYFINLLGSFRFNCRSWLSGIPGPDKYVQIPGKIDDLLMHSEWDVFFDNDTGLRAAKFAVVLYFFAANDAPLQLRQQFWLLLLDKPVFDDTGCVGSNHHYYRLFERLGNLPPQPLVAHGAFYNLISGDPFSQPGSKWDAYNIWGCRGVYNETVGGVRRYVEVFFKIPDDDHNPIDWDIHGMLQPECLMKSGVECYPWFAGDSNEALSVTIDSE